jgi:YidC/Oxa1 family membrane protein insertase
MDPNENKPFDFRMILAFVLMFAIVMIYTMYMQPEAPETTKQTATESDRPAPTTSRDSGTVDNQTPQLGVLDTVAVDSLFMADSVAVDTVVVETPLFTARFSTRGADIVSYQLNKYHYITDKETDEQISLIPKNSGSALRFEFWGAPLQLERRGFTTDRDRVTLTAADDSSVVRFSWSVDETHTITKTYIFYPDRYSFDIILNVPGDFPIPLEREYTFGWDAGLEPTESGKKEDIENIAAVARLGKDLEEIKEIDDSERPQQFGGNVIWAGVRTKYFINIVIPRSVEPQAFIADRTFGFVQDREDKYKIPYFSARVAVPISPRQPIDHRYTVYMGPLDYFVVKDEGLGLEGLLHLGYKYIIRPFAIFVLWSFEKLYGFVPNYGFVIILFGFLVKVIFHPLTKKSMVSMQRMKEMQPKLQKIREKYKEDPQRMNRETMKMYKETGFNPLSGCLPLLAQMPVFFALYQVLRSSIQMRGAEFIFHITDLSQKDSLFILPIIMTVSFFWQQKMSATDPKQKALVYIMPLIFGFLFAQSPAGLTLYWTVYNIFSVIEQYIIKGSKKNEGAGSS